ncbi:MAG: Sensor histidine kinase VicK [candidate division WWE3 bacterium GW2011_GWA1_41_8]|uniref:histidine kinase n=4 Tax=Katanobacteria TaxID=422282 RepID=A0A0G1ABB1_UNCKA|nr:MAG: Sensor histidine kinase VicK [candidate division WWE3 bacterium GW2011_GWA1_41_8]OGC58319.1 MAG: hypothetical protein A2976_03110 [candidate division WWE3 bacterium RIFCSPLOWO2_01_FULL_41_9]
MDIDYIKTLQPEKIAEEVYKKNVELLEQRRRTEQLLYWVSELIFAVDDKYNITLFNHTAERLLKKNSSDVLGKNANEIIKLRTDKGQPITVEEYTFQGDPSKGSLEGAILTGVDQDFFVNVKTSVIQLQDSKECLITLVDVTKEKQLDKTKDDFISITSHELRTPLTIIKSYLWMLEQGRGGPMNEKQTGYLSKAIRGAERMLNLVNDTLNLARIEQGKIAFKMEQITLNDFFKEILEEFKIKTDEKGLYLKLNVGAGVPNIYADRNKLREIIINFLGNSIKFTQEGGISIAAEKVNHDTVKILVTDTGKGISREDIPRLFSKFGRLDNSYQTIAETGGTGLGLYITKSLVERMGGRIGVSSDGVGLGSTFWFTVTGVDSEATICTLIQG